MNKRFLEILNRKRELGEKARNATAAELDGIEAELNALEAEETQLRQRQNLLNRCSPIDDTAGASGCSDAIQQRAAAFRSSGHLDVPLFGEQKRSILASGTIAKPTVVGKDIGTLPDTISSIVDDVKAIPITGSGSYTASYLKTKPVATSKTEGAKNTTSTGSAFDTVTINPATWDVLDSVSECVKEQTDIDYMGEAQSVAVLALKEVADAKIVAAILASSIAQKRFSIALNENFLRDVVLGYTASRRFPGVPKLYINRHDLITLGKVKGTNEKQSIYTIQMDADNVNGTISEGGCSARFSIDDNLSNGVQLYGNPQTVHMPMWGNYSVRTDESGHYFDEGMIGVRAKCSANAGLCVKNGMHIIKQAAS